MENLNFINFRALSKELTGNSTTIRQNNITGSQEPIFNELSDLLEYWLKRYKSKPYINKDKPRGKPRGRM